MIDAGEDVAVVKELQTSILSLQRQLSVANTRLNSCMAEKAEAVREAAKWKRIATQRTGVKK